MRSSVTGTILAVYDAYRYGASSSPSGGPAAEAVCSSDYLLLDVEARASSVTWQSGSARVGGHYQVTTETAQVTESMQMPADPANDPWYADPSPPISESIETYMYLMRYNDTQPVHFQPKYFRVTNSTGAPSINVLPSIKFVGLPHYLPGVWTYLIPGCVTTLLYRHFMSSIPQLAPLANYVSNCYPLYMDATIQEFGLNQMASTFPPFKMRPFSPFATAVVKQTNASGVGWVSVNIYPGKPVRGAHSARAARAARPRYLPTRPSPLTLNLVW